MVFALTVFISIRLHLPFKKILKEIGFSRLADVEPSSHQRDEEAFILDSIRKMSLKNEQITEELSQRVALLKQAQAVALQSQINPHFLHNTLDSISWTAIRLTGGKTKPLSCSQSWRKFLDIPSTMSTRWCRFAKN